MFTVDFNGTITKYYGTKLNHVKSLGFYCTDNYLLAVAYSNAIKIRNNYC